MRPEQVLYAACQLKVLGIQSSMIVFQSQDNFVCVCHGNTNDIHIMMSVMATFKMGVGLGMHVAVAVRV